MQVVAQLVPPLQPPVDLTATLQSLVDGTAALQPESKGIALPLLVQRSADVVKRSSQLLGVFRLLSHSLNDCAQLVRSFPHHKQARGQNGRHACLN
jgi:hypothetical protein